MEYSCSVRMGESSAIILTRTSPSEEIACTMAQFLEPMPVWNYWDSLSSIHCRLTFPPPFVSSMTPLHESSMSPPTGPREVSRLVMSSHAHSLPGWHIHTQHPIELTEVLQVL